MEKEIQNYIQDMKIDTLFGAIFECLLKDKPDNAISYLIEYLHNHFPEETRPTINKLIEEM